MTTVTPSNSAQPTDDRQARLAAIASRVQAEDPLLAKRIEGTSIKPGRHGDDGVCCLTDGMRFTSLESAAAYYGLSSRGIGNSIAGKRAMKNGLRFNWWSRMSAVRRGEFLRTRAMLPDERRMTVDLASARSAR